MLHLFFFYGIGIEMDEAYSMVSDFLSGTHKPLKKKVKK